MTTLRSFYCVCCERLLVVEQAEQLFRTGFYMVDYPLGLCASCECRKDKRD